ncbi:MAG: hypothetical protein JW754_04190 [Candidatus Aenigmarchaeota archaeon]|nr:hypothetical protein [Candidatus Aenigmarchaeota archaeon]
MRKSRLVLCPHCDREQRVKINETSVKCKGCKKTFRVKKENGKHPEHFWHNPDTSHHF